MMKKKKNKCSGLMTKVENREDDVGEDAPGG